MQKNTFEVSGHEVVAVLTLSRPYCLDIEGKRALLDALALLADRPNLRTVRRLAGVRRCSETARSDAIERQLLPLSVWGRRRHSRIGPSRQINDSRPFCFG